MAQSLAFLTAIAKGKEANTLRKVFALALTFLLLTPPNTASAADTALISMGVNATNCGGAPKSNNYSQRMVAGTNVSISKVIINLSAAQSSDYVEIRAINAVGTSGTLVGTLAYSSSSAVNTYFASTFIGNVSLTSGSQYWFILRGTTADSICFDSSAYTSTNGFDFAKSGSDYQWSYNFTAFTYVHHWSMNIYSGALDSTPPTFPSTETFSINENQSQVGTISASESSTFSIFGGSDQNKFSLARIDSVSAALSFTSAPNYELPTDTGQDNIYQVAIRASDVSNNAGYETVTVTVTDVDENARLLSYTVSGAQTKGQVTTLVATVNAPGKVTFLANGKRIGGCIGKPTVGSGPITATCQWKSALRGNVALSFTVVPSAVNYFSTTSQPSYLVMGRRGNTR